MKALFPIKKEYVKKKEEAYMEDKLKHILARSSACIWYSVSHQLTPYFEGRDKACAYVVGNVNVFLKPKTLQDYGIDAVPQIFCYIR